VILWVTLPSLDPNRLSEEEPTPLRSVSTLAKQNKAGSMLSSWVLQTVKEIRHFVLLLCKAFKEELLALFTAIKASHSVQG
jgi:hypothetical protein